jgi:amino acid adenylation domain-containing protein
VSGFTTIPRWTLHPVPGVSEHETIIPDELVTALRVLADELAVPLNSVLLAAHGKVLAALSGEPELATGYVAVKDGRALPCGLTIGAGSWRTLVLDTHQAEPGLTGSWFETVFDPTGDAGDLGDDIVLRVETSQRLGRLTLLLRYRTDVIDADCAARIAGYHIEALALMAADPDAEHGRQCLLSAEELRFQLDGLAGPSRELPDRRVHELFEEGVRAHPDAVAAVHGERRWTYRELNSRANRLGRALRARGLRREDVVTVVTERNLDWMAAVLAIFKAGGVYLPIEPQFPADRIAAILTRSRCALVLTEPGSTTTLDKALDSLSGIERVFVDEAYAEDHADGDLGLPVAADQLAYILFTSGSTGEPKGAMCEHAGMLNHIYAKIADLEIGEGEVVPQTGPQCFDISVWQLVAALLLGGRTLLVDQDVILDVERFVDTIAGGRARVLQAVPSYLDVVLSYLEQHPRPLPDLHSVSPTGDFVKKELVERWFAAYPDMKMVNTYGLTETSDDAVHEVMDRVPDGPRVPLGRPIHNVRVYVVDEHLRPVPLGAPGLIVFSGVCVGRGYINDPERTRLMYLPDPHREGERLCRTGDYGRWQPGGKLEFLGRRDNQVKIRGFRIEIGEIENALLRLAGVRDGAVVAAEAADRSRCLVAFYSGPGPLDVDVLRSGLRETLPDYMVPSAFQWREALPLTPNGKIDRRMLATLAGDLHSVNDRDCTLETPAERRVAAAWAKVLGSPEGRIGREDDFFELGGTSLSAVKLAIALGGAVPLKALVRHPVLAAMATLVDRKGNEQVEMSSTASTGSAPEVEIQPGRPPILLADAAGSAETWVAGHREELRAAVAGHGSILVRGLGLSDPAEVAGVFRRLSTTLMTETEAFAARQSYGEGVYSSSKWPANQPMCMHHELSYALEVPGLMLFACLAAPTEGGATAVADSPAVLDALPAELVIRFERDGWLLTRNYNDEIGASVASAFGTDERAAVESYCRANAIEAEWQPDGGLRTRQRRPAVVPHPVTGQRCWFNQIAFLSEWTIDPEVHEYLVDVYGDDGLPFNTRFGNGDPIDADVVQLINQVYEAHTVREPWAAGDLLLVDNVRTAHSREAFGGQREILVAMADPVRPAEVAAG